MGSLSLIVVLIIVVWVIVLAPMVMGNNKPIRRSGEGYDETRVLHTGGSAPVEGRRRPKLTRADVHRFNSDAADYEVVEAEEPGEEVLLARTEPETDVAVPVEGEVVAEQYDGDAEPEQQEGAVQEGAVQEGGSTAYSVLKAAESGEEGGTYELDDTYISPADYGYDGHNTAGEAAVAELPHEVDGVGGEDAQGAEAEQEEDLTDEEIAFAQSRRGRGGWDPEREKASKADRFQRRQRTLLGLIIADVIAFVFAFVAGGWAWLAPALTIVLTVWFMLTLRSVVRQERALHARRVRQLRRARMGVVTSTSGDAARVRRRPGAVIVELDDDSPDFDELPAHRVQPVAERPVLRAG